MSDTPTRLTGPTVIMMAEAQAHTGLPSDVAARIAAGATNAVRAVTAVVGAPAGADGAPSLFDTEPAQYALELERLADRQEP